MEALNACCRIFSELMPASSVPRAVWLSLAAALCSITLTALFIRIATVRGWVVVPSRNRWNKRTVAQFGGAPILLTFWFAALLLPNIRQYSALLISTAAISLLGLVDDIRGLGPKPKLMTELLLATFAVYSGIVCHVTPSLGVNQALTLLWIVGITNAFNLIDNMDGLAGGAAIISLAAIALLTGLSAPIGTLSLLLMASIGGFLLFNLNPAAIFMGDLGALPIGFFLACASVMAATSMPRQGASVVIPCLLLLIPVFDVFLVSVTRRWRCRAISEGARDHTSHRLVLLGMSDRRAVAILHSVALLAATQALVWGKSQSNWTTGLLALFLIGVVHSWWYLAKMRLPESVLSRAVVAPVPEFVRVRGPRLLNLLRVVVLSALGAYFASLVLSDRQHLEMFGRFGVVAAIVCFAKLASFSASGLYPTQGTSSDVKEPYRIVTSTARAGCFAAPCWFLAGLSFTGTLQLIAGDLVFTTLLLVSSRLSDTVLPRLSAARLRLSIVRARSFPSRTSPRHEPAPTSAVDLSRLAARHEVADEVEL
jgi:UDP-GlcNAc:undecaprenyl-phosphate GlcNAc-1-phosphate transferase